MIDGNTPVYVNNDSRVINYGLQCVTDLATGTDSTLWALSCTSDSNGDYQVVKYNPNTKKWYIVNGAKGIKISAYNEISVAVTDSAGKIHYTSAIGTSSQATYLT
jgi:hypothetical protein